LRQTEQAVDDGHRVRQAETVGILGAHDHEVDRPAIDRRFRRKIVEGSHAKVGGLLIRAFARQPEHAGLIRYEALGDSELVEPGEIVERFLRHITADCRDPDHWFHAVK